MPENFLSAMGPLADPSASFQQGIQDTLGNQQAVQNQAAGAQNMQVQAFKLQQAQQEAQQQQQEASAYHDDVSKFIANPSADMAAQIAVKHPQFEKQIHDSFNLMDKSAQDSTRQGLALAYSTLKAGRSDIALDYLTKRQQANQVAGKPDARVDTLIDTIQKAPDKAQGVAAYMLSSIPGGEDFAKTLTAVGDGENKTHVLSPGAELRDDAGTLLARNQNRTQYKEVTDPVTGEKSFFAMGGSDGGGAGKAGPISGRAAAYADALSASGLPKNAVAGMVGNLHIESGFDPSGVGDGGQAVGVAQWHAPRAAAFKKMTGVEPADATPQQAAAFMKAEIDQLPPKQRDAILNAPTPAAAAAAIDKYYERSDGSTRSARMAAAQAWAKGGDMPGSGQSPEVRDVTPASLKGGDLSGLKGGLTPDAIDTAADLGLQKFNGSPPPGYSRNKPAQAAVANRIAEKIASFGGVEGAIAHAQMVHAQGKALDSFVGGPNANAIRTASVAIDHLATLGAAADALGNGNLTVFNKIGNFFSRSTGSEAPTDFEATKGIVSQEVAKFIGAGHITDKSITDVQAGINAASSPAQLKGYVRQMMTLMGGQLHGLGQQYEATTGRHDFTNFLSPAAQRMFAAPSGGQAGGQQQQGPARAQAAPTRSLRNPQTGKIADLINGQWVVRP